MRKFHLLATIIIIGTICLAQDKPPDKPTTEKITVITGGTVFTVTKGIIKEGVIFIKGGKIIKVDSQLFNNIEIPADAKVINAFGKYIMPGIVDAHSHMGVYSWPAGDDGNEATSPITAQVRAEDSIDLADPAFKYALAGGVTTVLIIPGSANLIGGEGVVLKLRVGKLLDEMKFKDAPRQLKMAQGENPKRVYGSRGQMPSTRMGNFAVLRETFIKTKEYIRKWETYEKKIADYKGELEKWEKSGGKDEKGEEKKKPEEPTPPDKNLQLETLADVLRGKLRVQWHCYRADEIVNMIKLADEFGFKIAALHHALDAYKVADEIARQNIGVATFVDWWGFKVEAFDAIPQAPAILTNHGVRVVLKSDSADMGQRLYTEAAKTIRYGMAENDAMKTITINAAWVLGIDDKVGSIEVGKDADIAIFSKHPFDVYTLCEMTIINGEVVFDRKINRDYFGAVKQ
ncbi:MAG: hypothetical protein A2W23_09290 [Planctomycetes bacterium RBG_16_43_13]|nr:MAG: hypothetical protein A2W23_09290 [Planctomycetes bacterium RBG_16_43_13]